MSWLPQIVAGDGKNATKSLRKQYTSRTLSRLAKLKTQSWHTLGAGNLYAMVRTPEGESENEWIALNVVDFFNELAMLFEFSSDTEQYQSIKKPGEGFPDGCVYRWKEPGAKKPVLYSSVDYVENVLTWIEAVIENTDVFPDEDDDEFPPDFVQNYVADIFVKMFRIFAILYSPKLHEGIKKLEGNVDSHLNTSFKHYVYFGMCFNVLPDEKELTPMMPLIKKHKKSYEESLKTFKANKDI